MQWLIDLVIEAIGIPPTYIDRGDPAAADWSQATLTVDSAWHDLDVSAIVPANASAIVLRGIIRDNLVDKSLVLRKSGNVNTWANSGIITQVGGVFFQGDFIIGASPSEEIEYSISAGMDLVFLTVGGWFL